MKNDIGKIIEKVVRERLSDDNVNILGVKVEEDTDFEGETVYRVMVIFDSISGNLDPKKTLGLVRHTRSDLINRNEDRFPIFRFISQSDAKKLGAAAA